MSPSAIELLDDVAIGRARANPAYRDSTRFVQGDPKAVLIVEWSGAEREIDERFAGLEELAGAVGATAATPLRSKEEMDQTVRLRKSTLPLLLGTTDREKPVAFVEDAAVPPDRLEEFVARFEEIVEENGTWACFYGHASVGCLHVRPALDTSDPEGVSRMRHIAEEVADLVVDCGGSISGEHGDGLSRSEFLKGMYGEEILRAFGDVERLFDPKGMMNPGAIVDPPPMDRQLRIGPGRKRLPLKTNLSFGDQGGFAKAIELCNGQRALPQEDRRNDVSFLHGYPRRAGHHEGAGQHAPLRDRRHVTARGADRRAYERGDGPLRRLQGVQDGMPLRRGRGLS